MKPLREGGSRKTKVLFFLRDLRLAGGERCVVSVINGLDRERFIPILAAFDASGPLSAELSGDLVIHNRGLKQGGIASFLPDFFRLYRFLCRVIVQERPDLLFCSNWLASLVGGYYRSRGSRGVKLVMVSHTPIEELLFSSAFGRLLTPLKRLVTSCMFQKADRVVAITAGMKDQLIRSLGVAETRIRVIHNGIDQQRIGRLAVAEVWEGACGTSPYFVAVGRLEHEKGFDLLLDAFRAVAGELSHNLVLVGEGSQRKHLETRVEAADLSERVFFAGALRNPYPAMKGADFLVVSSRFESFSCVLLEALALDLPVISTECEGPVTILDKGEYGVLVKKDDVAGLAHAMLQLAGDPGLKNSFRAKSRSRASAFSLDSMVRQYQDLFKDND